MERQLRRLHNDIIRKLKDAGYEVEFSTSSGKKGDSDFKIDVLENPFVKINDGRLLLKLYRYNNTLRATPIATLTGVYSDVFTRYLVEGRDEEEGDRSPNGTDLFESNEEHLKRMRESFNIKWLSVIKKDRGRGLAQLSMILFMLNAAIREPTLFSFHLEDDSDNVSDPTRNIYLGLGFRRYFHKADFEPERFKLKTDLERDVSTGILTQKVKRLITSLSKVVDTEKKRSQLSVVVRSKSTRTRRQSQPTVVVRSKSTRTRRQSQPSAVVRSKSTLKQSRVSKKRTHRKFLF